MWTEWELLSRLLNFGMYSFLCFHWWDCLPSSSVCSYPLMIFCSAGLVVMNLLNLFWFWIVFISPLILRDNFAKEWRSSLPVVDFQTLTYAVPCFLVCFWLKILPCFEFYISCLSWYFPLCILLWFFRFAALIYCL